MPGVSRFCNGQVRGQRRQRTVDCVTGVVAKLTLVVVYRLEHLFGRDQKMRHLPDGHFKVHLGELEEPEGKDINMLASISRLLNR